jgi:hypothetical protein
VRSPLSGVFLIFGYEAYHRLTALAFVLTLEDPTRFRERPHFRLQRLNPGRNSSCTEPPKCRLRVSEWKRGKGVPSWIVGALVITLTLTREAFSWKPFLEVKARVRWPPQSAMRR